MTGHEPDWLGLLERLELTHGEPHPVPPIDDDWEALRGRYGMIFPDDYKRYCIHLGPGDWSGAFHIAVPKLGKEGGKYDLDRHNEWMHPSNPDIDMIGQENLSLFQRAVHFASDVVGNSYYWDPTHIQETGNYVVSAWKYSMEFESVANSFWEFVREICLGDRGTSLIADFSPRQSFAAWSRA